MSVDARKSSDRRYIICGLCGRSLCRRNRQEWPDGRVLHVLTWEDGWYRVDDHLEMQESAQRRLAAGNKPGRADWLDEGRIDLTAFRRTYPPAKCPDCGTVNVFHPKRLDVDGIASH